MVVPVQVDRRTDGGCGGRDASLCDSWRERQPLVLAALALLTLVLASGSLVHQLARSQGLWRKA